MHADHSDASAYSKKLSKVSNGLRWAGRLYVVFWMTAIGGLVAANIGALVGMWFAEENKAEMIRPWMHGGWCLGAVLAFVSAVTGKLRMLSGDRFSLSRNRSSVSLQSEAACRTESTTPMEWRDDSDPDLHAVGEACSKSCSSIGSSTAFFGLAGGLLGLMLGGSFLIFFFSLAFSPFSPRWASSVKLERKQTTTESGQRVWMSRNSVATSLILAPVVAGVTIGAIIGGVGAAKGKITDG